MLNTIKKPSDHEYLEYDGAHCTVIWKSLNDNWKCPSCKRTKREIMRWTKRSSSGRTFWGWIAGFTEHHDHSDCLRFNNTIIRFVTSTPHAKHNINFKKAKNIYDSLQ